jgi:carbamate kinase
MGPKVEANVNFLAAGSKQGLFSSPALLDDAMDGRAGIHFVGKI